MREPATARKAQIQPRHAPRPAIDHRPGDAPAFEIATFNVKNLALPGADYYAYERYTDEEYAWKQDWLSDQLLTMDADIVGLQEIFDEAALRALIEQTNEKGHEINVISQPGPNARYRRKRIFRKLAFSPYQQAAFFAPNIHDGAPGMRRPGLALLSRHPFIGTPEIFQDLTQSPGGALEIPLDMGAGAPATYRLEKLSRPVLKARLNVHGHPVTVFNLHLKSKLPEFMRPEGARFAAEQDLVNAQPFDRAIGAYRALMRRAGEALAVRRLVLEEIETGAPVIVLGDFNDNLASVTSEIICGERPFKNYSWMRRHDAERPNARYSAEEDALIRGKLERVGLWGVEQLFVKRSMNDMVFTSTFGGVYESVDQILLSRHFHPDAEQRIAELEYLQAYNDHLTDAAHPEAPYNKLVSDHGQLVASLRFRSPASKDARA